MNDALILPLSDPQASLDLVGGKGASLARLTREGLPVPDGFHISTTAYWKFVDANDLGPGILTALGDADPAQPESLERAAEGIRALFEAAVIPDELAGAIEEGYLGLSDVGPNASGDPHGGRQHGPAVPVAVRSSATAEDLPEASFAGQQDSFLNVSGVSAVLEATKKCWRSLWTARAIGYRLRQGIDQGSVSLAVVVQLMAPAEAAGVLFTANPLNGRRDEMMISAAWGLGESVVGGTVTPDTLILDKADLRVVSRQTGDKKVMTVQVVGGTEERPVPERLQTAPVLDDESAGALARYGLQIEDSFEMPMDIEWVFSDGAFSIVQARPITALPELSAKEPVEWKLPDHANRALRNNIVELMADPLTPLFETLGLKSINASLRRLLSRFMGHAELMPEEIILSVNHYAYYNGSLTLRQIGGILLRSVGIARRMFTGVEERWHQARPQYAAAVASVERSAWREAPSVAILNGVSDLMEAVIDFYGTLLGGVIPAAWISEGIFTAVYKLLIRGKNDPSPATFLLGFDSAPILAEKALYDLASWARDETHLAPYLVDTPASRLADHLEQRQTPSGLGPDEWRSWRGRFQAHLETHGHAIYNLDFANPVPADDPEPLLETCRLFLRGAARNPYERQQAAADRRERATREVLGRLRGLRLKLFQKTLLAAQKYAPLREDGLAEIGLGYPLLRRMLLEVGRRFTEAGMVENPAHIFWLEHEEVASAAQRWDREVPSPSLAERIPERKAAWRAASRVAPPLMLPQIRLFGLDLAKLRKPRADGDRLKGVAASPGRVKAAARVLHGPGDFDQMQVGDVLVAAITTPAWTPLFVRASAVVTDVGGPLSHGSIVAREYGIPAVLGTGAATARIHDGQEITVDGDEGLVYLG
jgi:pyruvate,water dikinase